MSMTFTPEALADLTTEDMQDMIVELQKAIQERGGVKERKRIEIDFFKDNGREETRDGLAFWDDDEEFDGLDSKAIEVPADTEEISIQLWNVFAEDDGSTERDQCLDNFDLILKR